jgi:hypothetical protein
MRVVPVLLGLLLVAVPSWAQDCKLVQVTSLPISNVGSVLTLNATLDDVPAPLALGMGGENVPMNRLYKSFTDAHKFEIQRANYGNVRIVLRKNDSEINMATIHQFALGPVKGANIDFLIQPEDQPSPEVAGTLMQSALKDFDFELDIQGKKLNLFQQSHCPGQVIYWPATVVARLPFLSANMDGRFQMVLDGKTVRVLLAPDSSSSEIGSKAMHRLFGIDLDSPGVERIAGSPDGDPRYSYHFSSLMMDALTIRNPSITIYVQKQECLEEIQPGRGRCFGGHDMTLGAPILRQLRMFFANKERMLYLTQAGAQ